ncbi:unnamed protein product [Strongylus vulgaris]|uniref:Uncharacterized protein n=1 Tax=Strongylus vulgaris TaxID=40348 RepID=A0A3P7LSM0_STRVU|nr:unnamed protein product [Strongylus vulgaris]
MASFGGFEAAVPVVHAAPMAIAAPVYPAVHSFYHHHHGLPVEVRNTMRTTDKEAGHFSGTMHRSSDFGFPFHKRN